MTDYMQTPEETAKQPDAYKVFEEIADGDVRVYNFLVSFWNFEHVFDDLLDNSTMPVEKKEMAMKALHDFVVDLLLNPFVRQHASELRALMVSAITRNMDGDSIKQKELSPAVRCGDVDLIVHVAYLAGGWAKMREISKRREYDTTD